MKNPSSRVSKLVCQLNRPGAHATHDGFSWTLPVIRSSGLKSYALYHPEGESLGVPQGERAEVSSRTTRRLQKA